MNLKILSISVLILALLSGLVAWLDRPAPSTDADPRVGASLLADVPINDATAITLTNNNDVVRLVRGAEDNWLVESYHQLPVDTDKLRRLLGELSEAEIIRAVTRNPERAARLELGQAAVTIEAAGATTRLTFGKAASRGGRYLRLAEGEDTPVYLTPASVYLDGVAKNWANSALTTLSAADVQSLTFAFADGTTLEVSRDSTSSAWTTADLPEGSQLRAQPISSLLSTLGYLRFNDTAPLGNEAVQAAQEHRHSITLTTFGSETLTWHIGRKPEETIVKEAETNAAAAMADLAAGADMAPESAEDALADLTETVPAGPVYVAFEGPAALVPLIDAQAKLAFQVPDHIYTGLPGTRADLIEEIGQESTAPILPTPLAP
jgi:hypothetical protein